jgi:hypothetical protein
MNCGFSVASPVCGSMTGVGWPHTGSLIWTNFGALSSSVTRMNLGAVQNWRMRAQACR